MTPYWLHILVSRHECNIIQLHKYNIITYVHIYIYIYWLVVWNICSHIIIGNNHPNWLIFFRGVETTNQYTQYTYIYIYIHIYSMYIHIYIYICMYICHWYMSSFLVTCSSWNPLVSYVVTTVVSPAQETCCWLTPWVASEIPTSIRRDQGDQEGDPMLEERWETMYVMFR